jgi:hypothetical protein
MKIRHYIRQVLEESMDDFKKWKRNNVTYRGMKEIGQENNAGAMLGDGLYTAPLSNKSLAKQYGSVRYVVNGRPKNPIVFKSLNLWEIWLQNLMYKTLGYKKRHDFEANTSMINIKQKYKK